MYCEPQLKEIIDRQRPDVIIEDNVNGFPALTTAGVPFVRIVSCQPLEMKGPDMPPTYSGLPADDRTRVGRVPGRVRPHPSTDVAGVQRLGAVVRRPLRWPISSSSTRATTSTCTPIPKVIDYTDRRPLGPTWHRLDSSVRATDAPFEVPAELGTDDPDASSSTCRSARSARPTSN